MKTVRTRKAVRRQYQAVPAPSSYRMGCVEREDGGEKVLFGLEIQPEGWHRIQELLRESPQLRLVFRIVRGETAPFTGWRFVASPEIPETVGERRVVSVDFQEVG